MSKLNIKTAEKWQMVFLIALVFLFVGCGGDDEKKGGSTPPPTCASGEERWFCEKWTVSGGGCGADETHYDIEDLCDEMGSGGDIACPVKVTGDQIESECSLTVTAMPGCRIKLDLYLAGTMSATELDLAGHITTTPLDACMGMEECTKDITVEGYPVDSEDSECAVSPPLPAESFSVGVAGSGYDNLYDSSDDPNLYRSLWPGGWRYTVEDFVFGDGGNCHLRLKTVPIAGFPATIPVTAIPWYMAKSGSDTKIDEPTESTFQLIENFGHNHFYLDSGTGTLTLSEPVDGAISGVFDINGTGRFVTDLGETVESRNITGEFVVNTAEDSEPWAEPDHQALVNEYIQRQISSIIHEALDSYGNDRGWVVAP